MKTIILFLLTIFILVGPKSFAQQNPEKQKLDYLNDIEKHRKMKSGGAVLTVLGSLCMFGGAALFRDSGSGEGLGLFVVGMGGVCSGIPIMAYGAYNQKKYERKLQGELNVRINSTSQGTGLTLSYRF